MDKHHQNSKMYGWIEEHYNDVCREFDTKWRLNRHLYYSADKLAEVFRKEAREEDAQTRSI